MDKESLEHISRLQSLEAENKHLKSLLNKVATPKSERQSGVDNLLQDQIELLTQRGLSFADTVASILSLLGDYLGVDRVSVFSSSKENGGFCASHQWARENVQEYHPSDLVIEYEENPLSRSNKSYFSSTDLKNDLKSSLAQKFEIFEVESLLILPMHFPTSKNSLLVVESCQFKREWYGFEIDELIAAEKIADASFMLKWQHESIVEEQIINKLIHNVTSIVSQHTNAKKAIKDLLNFVGKELHLDSLYVVEKGNFSENHEFFYHKEDMHDEGVITNFDIDKLKPNNSSTVISIYNVIDFIKNGIDYKPRAEVVLTHVTGVKGSLGWIVVEGNLKELIGADRLNLFFTSLSNVIANLLRELGQESVLNSKCTSLLEENKILADKEKLLADLFREAPFGIILTEHRLIKKASSFVLDSFGWQEEEVVGQSIISLIKSDKINDSFFEKVIEEKYAVVEIDMQEKDGVSACLQLSAVCKGGLGDCVMFMQDISLNRKATKQAYEYKQILDSICNASIDGGFVIDEKREVVFANQALIENMQAASSEISKINISTLFSEESWQTIDSYLSQNNLSGNFFENLKVINSNSDEQEVEVSIVSYSQDGKVYHYFSIHRKENGVFDVGNVESAGFKTLTQGSPNIILQLNREGQVLYFNDALVHHFRFLDKEAIVGQRLMDLGVWDELVGESWRTKISDVFASGEKMFFEQGFSDETRELYFDWTMLPEVSDNQAAEKIFVIGRDATARKRLEKQLEEAKVKADESEKLKNSFLANMSHELRTPLNAIVGFSALLRGKDISDAEKEEYVEVIHKNSDNLLNLINNIIDVAKIDSGKISIEKEEVDLNELMTSLYNDFASKVEIEHRGRVKLYLSKPDGNVKRFVSDPIRLRQVLVNLIGNAIKFTIKGFIEFGYKQEDDKIRFYVKDTGIGISAAKQSMIFQPFRKEEEDSNQIYGGTGIGLAICEKIVNALGGHIGLESEKGQGSEFYFVHPYLQEEENGLNSSNRRFYTISQPVIPKTYYWPNKLVLLVDESSSAHLQMRKFIEKTGLTLVSARTAAGASKLLMNRSDVHMVIMDLNFPDSNGFDLVNIIKTQNKEIPVIAHTLDVRNGERDALLQRGFDDCVAKPTVKEELLDVIDRFFAEV